MIFSLLTSTIPLTYSKQNSVVGVFTDVSRCLPRTSSIGAPNKGSGYMDAVVDTSVVVVSMGNDVYRTEYPKGRRGEI